MCYFLLKHLHTIASAFESIEDIYKPILAVVFQLIILDTVEQVDLELIMKVFEFNF